MFFEKGVLNSRQRIKKNSGGGGGAESLSKNVSQLGQLTKKIVQLKSFKIPRSTW